MEDTIRIKDAASLDNFPRFLESVDNVKTARIGGSLVTFPDKEREMCELSTTYMVKPGRFSKEQRIIVTLMFKRSDGVYNANMEKSVFHIVSDEKGGLKEIWSGDLSQARERIGEIANHFCEALAKFRQSLSS